MRLKAYLKSTPLVLILIVVCFLLPACGRDNAPEAPATTADPGQTESSGSAGAGFDAAAWREFILNGSFTSNGRSTQEIGKEWAALWLEKTYPGHGITDVQAFYISAAHTGRLSDSIDIQPILCSLEFSVSGETGSSAGGISGAVKLADNRYELTVMVVTVSEKDSYNNLILSGFLGPDAFEEYNAMPEVYRVVAGDPRFAQQLRPYPQFDLPAEFTAVDLRQITGTTGKTYLEHMLPGGIIASIILNKEKQQAGQRAELQDDQPYELRDLEVALYDLAQNKSLGRKTLGSYYSQNSKIEEGKLVIHAWTAPSAPVEIITIDSAWNISREVFSEGKNYVRFSPDGTRYAYSDRGSLYLAWRNGEKPPRLLLKGNASAQQDRNYYYPFCWADNNKIVYGIGGYEWSNGCGVYDLAAGQNIFLEQAGNNASPSDFRDGKLYTVTGDMGAPYDPCVIDLTDPDYPARKVFADAAFLEKVDCADHALSPDGTKIALLAGSDNPEDGEYRLYICSAADGSLLKEYEFTTVFNSAQYLDFADNNLLAVFSQRYAFAAKYMYLVRVD